MSRQLRPDFDGALHHVYNRGLDGRAIFRSDTERRLFLELLGMVALRFGWFVHAYTLMTTTSTC